MILIKLWRPCLLFYLEFILKTIYIICTILIFYSNAINLDKIIFPWQFPSIAVRCVCITAEGLLSC